MPARLLWGRGVLVKSPKPGRVCTADASPLLEYLLQLRPQKDGVRRSERAVLYRSTRSRLLSLEEAKLQLQFNPVDQLTGDFGAGHLVGLRIHRNFYVHFDLAR